MIKFNPAVFINLHIFYNCRSAVALLKNKIFFSVSSFE